MKETIQEIIKDAALRVLMDLYTPEPERTAHAIAERAIALMWAHGLLLVTPRDRIDELEQRIHRLEALAIATRDPT